MTKKDIRKQARAWMIMNDIRIVDISNGLNMKSHVMVTETLSGKRDHKRVLQYLIAEGCPKEYLALPENMRVAA